MSQYTSQQMLLQNYIALFISTELRRRNAAPQSPQLATPRPQFQSPPLRTPGPSSSMISTPMPMTPAPRMPGTEVLALIFAWGRSDFLFLLTRLCAILTSLCVCQKYTSCDIFFLL